MAREFISWVRRIVEGLRRQAAVMGPRVRAPTRHACSRVSLVQAVAHLRSLSVLISDHMSALHLDKDSSSTRIRPRSSIRLRLISLILLAVMPAFGVNLYSAHEQKLAASTAAKQEALRLAREAVGRQRQLISEARNMLGILAQQPEVELAEPASCSAFLARQLNQYQRYSNLIFIDLKGDIRCSAAPVQSPIYVGDRSYFRKAVEARDFAVGQYLIGRVKGNAIVIFSYPVFNSRGLLHGVVAAALDLGWLNEFLAEAKVAQDVNVTVIDHNGVILARSAEGKKWIGKPFPQMHISRAVLSQQRGTIESSSMSGSRRLYAFSPLLVSGKAEAYVLIGLSTKAAYAAVRWIVMRNFLMLSLVAVIALTVSWFGSRLLILRPIDALVAATTRLAGGDLSARVPQPRGSGEFAQLSGHFNAMAESLESRRGQLKRTNRALRTISQCNKILVSASDEQELLKEMCRAILKGGGYRMAWVGYAEEDEAKTVRPVAQAGYKSGHVETLKLTWADAERGSGPLGTAIRTGKACVVKTVAGGPIDPLWRACATENGFASCIVLPLITNGTSFGVLSIHAAEPDAFDTEEEKLLSGLAEDLSFGIVALRDRAARHKAEVCLRETETRYRLLVESVQDYVIINVDPNGRVVDWNSGAENVTGYRPKEIIGNHISRFYTRMDIEDGLPGRALEIAAAKGRFEVESWLVSKDGAWFWGNVVITSIRSAAAELIGFSTVIRDLTSRKRAEEKIQALNTDLERRVQERTTELAQIEAWQRGILNSADLSIVSTDANGFVRTVNPVAERLLGYRAEELVGKAMSLAIYDPQEIAGRAAELSQELGRLIEPGFEVFVAKARLGLPDEREWTCIREDGGQFLVALSVTAVRDNEGNLAGFLGVAEDITERKAAEKRIRVLNAELKHQAAQLTAANKELKTFSYSVSHDLRAPLRSIDAFGGALLEDYADKLDERGKNYLQRIYASSKRMSRLIDDLLRLSRVTRSELRIKRVNLSEIAKAIGAELQQLHPDRRIEWVISDGLVVDADEGLMRVVMTNLLENAWKFTAKRFQGKIEFGITSQNDTPTYFVRDNGAGFDKAHASRLFGAFQRLHAQNEFPGTGIGLATVQHIINRHGGNVWAEGKIGQGATFCFTLLNWGGTFEESHYLSRAVVNERASMRAAACS
jgi:PAS domain S-box-containing protein